MWAASSWMDVKSNNKWTPSHFSRSLTLCVKCVSSVMSHMTCDNGRRKQDRRHAHSVEPKAPGRRRSADVSGIYSPHGTRGGFSFVHMHTESRDVFEIQFLYMQCGFIERVPSITPRWTCGFWNLLSPIISVAVLASSLTLVASWLASLLLLSRYYFCTQSLKSRKSLALK